MDEAVIGPFSVENIHTQLLDMPGEVLDKLPFVSVTTEAKA